MKDGKREVTAKTVNNWEKTSLIHLENINALQDKEQYVCTGSRWNGPMFITKYRHAAIPMPVIYPALTPAQTPDDEFTKLFTTALFLVLKLETPSNVHHKGTRWMNHNAVI